LATRMLQLNELAELRVSILLAEQRGGSFE
jgi:hypothetical protein